MSAFLMKSFKGLAFKYRKYIMGKTDRDYQLKKPRRHKDGTADLLGDIAISQTQTSKNYFFLGLANA